MIGAGLIPADAIGGYPPGVPLRTIHGAFHAICAIPGFLALVMACLMLAGGFGSEHPWLRRLGYVLGLAALAAFLASAQGVEGVPGFVARTGLFERLALLFAFGWLTIVSLYELWLTRPRSVEHPARSASR